MIRRFWQNLSIFKKMLLLFSIIMLIIIASIFLINNFVILESYKRLEQHYIYHNIQNVENMIKIKKESLDNLCLDWASWDDSYEFMETKNNEYIESNFADPFDTLETIQVNMIVYIDTEKEIIYSKYYDFETMKEKQLPEELLELMSSDSPCIESKGFLHTSQGFLMLSCHEILTSLKEGPSRGKLVMGYVFSNGIAEVQTAHAPEIELIYLDESDVLTKEVLLFSSLTASEKESLSKIEIAYPSLGEYNAYKLFTDINGDPSIALKVTGIREIYLHGRTTIKIILLVVFISTISLFILVLVPLNKLFFKRILDLNTAVRNIGNMKNSLKRIVLSGNDEITYLGRSINKCFNSLESAHEEVVKTQKMYEDLFKDSIDGIYRSTLDGQYLNANTALVKMLGYNTKKELLAINTKDLYINPEKRPDAGQRNRSFNAIFRKKDGSKIHVAISSRVVYQNGKPLHYDGIVRDISEQKNYEEKVKYLSFHDSLTGLYNRTFFDEELKRLRKTRQLPLSIVLGDVNGLKKINDTIGHYKGDILLKRIARILKQCFRSEDIISRIGGDEFCIILPSTSRKDTENIIKRVIDLCKGKSTKDIPLSISFGIAVMKKKNDKIKDVFRTAENMMYSFKTQGRKK